MAHRDLHRGAPYRGGLPSGSRSRRRRLFSFTGSRGLGTGRGRGAAAPCVGVRPRRSNPSRPPTGRTTSSCFPTDLRWEGLGDTEVYRPRSPSPRELWPTLTGGLGHRLETGSSVPLSSDQTSLTLGLCRGPRSGTRCSSDPHPGLSHPHPHRSGLGRRPPTRPRRSLPEFRACTGALSCPSVDSVSDTRPGTWLTSRGKVESTLEAPQVWGDPARIVCGLTGRTSAETTRPAD